MSQQDIILQVENLKKYFRTPKGMLHAVDDVSFDLMAGETLGVVGESGCGKSTLGRAILRLHEPTSGQVQFEGKNILEYDVKELKDLRKNMQIIFQDPYASLNPRYSVSQTIAEPLIIQNIFQPSEKEKIQKRVKELMDTVGLSQRLINAYPHEMDGGRRQRIGIARALALNPKFIVCDEPVSALDVSIQAQILNLMKDLQKEYGLTYMFITHNLSVVKFFSDNIIVMYLGKIVEKASINELFNRPLHPYTQALLSAIPIPDPTCKMERIPLKGELTSPIDPKPGCRFANRCIYAKESCFAESPELKPLSTDNTHFVACHLIDELPAVPPA